MPGTKVFTGFGLKAVYFAARVTVAGTIPTWVQMPSVEQAAFKLAVSEVEQWGDDKYQATFYHSQKGQLTVKGNKHSMAVFDLLSAGAVFTSGSNEGIYFGTQVELIPPRISARGVMPVRLDTGVRDNIDIIWFDCDVKTLWDSGPAAERAKITDVTIQVNTYPSATDEKNTALPGSTGGHAFGRFMV